MIKMYRVTIQDKNNPESERRYTCGEKEKNFYLQVFSGHYNIEVEEFFNSKDSEEQP